jgi:N-sulfoglucosamine sulfohydrolase
MSRVLKSFLFAGAMALLMAPATWANPRPNIVMIVTDDQGMDAGCYGNPVIRTPNLDSLAADGTRFTRAFATAPSCSASRSVILTGLHTHANLQYGHAHGSHHFRTRSDLKSLPILLGENGYRTARIGKFHVEPESVYKFDRVISSDDRNAVAMANASRGFVSAQNDKPFFLYFCPSDPHRGGGVNAQSPQRPNRFGNRDQGYPGVERHRPSPQEVIVPPFLPDTPEARAELVEYYESVNRIDQGLGRLIEILKEAGIYDQTLIVFTSDQGIAFPGAKTTVYEPGLQVPFVVRDPFQARRGDVNPAMISFVDITPTLLDYAGVDSRGARFQGRSFRSTMAGGNREAWNKIYASHTFHEITMYYPMRVVREARFKLIFNIAHPLPFPFASDLWASPTWQAQYRKGMDAMYGPRTVRDYIHRDRLELYDLENDPLESKNLAGDPAHARTLDRLIEDMKDWQRRTNDAWILKWNRE